MNPRDIMTDAIHNFHPQYQQYTQYSSDNKRFQNKGTGGDKGDNLNTSAGRLECSAVCLIRLVCYKHNSEHQLFLFGSTQFALINSIIYIFLVGSLYRTQP